MKGVNRRRTYRMKHHSVSCSASMSHRYELLRRIRGRSLHLSYLMSPGHWRHLDVGAHVWSASVPGQRLVNSLLIYCWLKHTFSLKSEGCPMIMQTNIPESRLSHTDWMSGRPGVSVAGCHKERKTSQLLKCSFIIYLHLGTTVCCWYDPTSNQRQWISLTPVIWTRSSPARCFHIQCVVLTSGYLHLILEEETNIRISVW